MENNLTNFLEHLGFKNEEVEIYKTLLDRRDLTILEISRYTGITRTQVYRIIGNMKAKKLVAEIVDQYRKKYRSVGIEALALLVKEQEEKTQRVSSLFPEVSSLLSCKRGLSEPNTKVLFYKGKEGIKQIVWNILKARGEDLGYTHINVDEALGKSLAENWREEAVRRKIKFRDITNNRKIFLQTALTKIKDYPTLFRTRYISPDKLNIDHQVDIYNDVIALYSWKEGDIFGVEIYNSTIVNLQKQIFNLLWSLAKNK